MPRTAAATALLALALLAGCEPSSPPRSQPSEPPAPESPQAPRDPATAALIRERCTRCHDTQRIEDASHDADGWRQTVDRMRSRGAELSDAEAERVAGFLSAGGGRQL